MSEFLIKKLCYCKTTQGKTIKAVWLKILAEQAKASVSLKKMRSP